MRVLITGASGFAGGYLARECASAGDEVIGASRSGALPAGSGLGRVVDLRDAAATQRLFADVAPQIVYHLAALSSVGRSWEDPASTMHDNVATAVSVLEAVRLRTPKARLVWVSSCEVYGTPAHLPVDEDAPLAPSNPYAVSKAAGDMLAAVYSDAHDLEVIRARPFNHAGPGQLPIFIVSSLAHQVAQERLAGADPIRIVTGNPDTRRDFTDVRDIARAYRLLAEHAKPGIYNVSSGRSISAAEHVTLLGELVGPTRVDHAVDPGLLRSHEVSDLRGANERLQSTTGWQPEIPFQQTMSDTLQWWEQELGAGAGGGGRPGPSRGA